MAHLLPTVQSGPCYSTETAVLSVLSDILLAVDCGDFAALVFLDLSVEFDMDMTSCCRDSRLVLASTALLSSDFSPT